jgi:hypothetical protein
MKMMLTAIDEERNMSEFSLMWDSLNNFISNRYLNTISFYYVHSYSETSHALILMKTLYTRTHTIL